jgi:putative transposase
MRPTARQAAALADCLEDHRQLYNAALEHRRIAWQKAAVTVRYVHQSADLRHIRCDDPGGQGRWSFSSQQATLRRLDKAFAAFFRRVKAEKKPGYPRFKGRGWFNTVEWPEDGDGCRWDCAPGSGQVRVRLQGIGQVKVHQHRPVRGTIKTISVKREGRRWYVIISCDGIPAEPLPSTGAAIGIDMGIAHFMTTSDGAHVPNPRYCAGSAARLADAQRTLSRCKRRSMRRQKARQRVASVHRKVRRQRMDFAHKTAFMLVRDHDLIAHEALRIGNMTRSARGSIENPGTNVAAKGGLNRSILDAGWGEFLNVLRAKAESAGRVVVEVDPRHTSQKCSQCGHIAAGNRVSRSLFHCLECGHSAHADMNAAQNILRAGLARRAASDAVREACGTNRGSSHVSAVLLRMVPARARGSR